MLSVIAASTLVRMQRTYLLSGVPPCTYQNEAASQGGYILGVERMCFISTGSKLHLASNADKHLLNVAC